MGNFVPDEWYRPPYQTHLCPACAAGLYEECSNPQLLEESTKGAWIVPCAVIFAPAGVSVTKPNGTVGRPIASPEDVTDPTSTGRKRAAFLAPILTGQRCAWAGLKFAGGGIQPILGCDGHELIEKKGGEPPLYQGDRHHGPDKNTLNNALGFNLHSICADCHHRWHALNDPGYGKRPDAARPFLPVEPYWPHDATTTFTGEEFAEAEAWWALPVKDRPPYPFRPDTEPLSMSEDPATLDPFENPFPDVSPFEIGES